MIVLALALTEWACERLKQFDRWLMCKKYPLQQVGPGEVDLSFVKAYEAEVKEVMKREKSRLKP